MICDTGPLVALIDRGDPQHRRCTDELSRHSATTLVTTWPCLTEAMHLLARAGGYRAQETLWSYLAAGLVQIHHPQPSEVEQTRELMSRYRDMPMDLADASLVAAANTLGERKVFSIDRHFRAFRSDRGEPFHRRGVTSCAGLYFLGLPWLHKLKSSVLCGIGDDAAHLADHIAYDLTGTRLPRAPRAPGRD